MVSSLERVLLMYIISLNFSMQSLLDQHSTSLENSIKQQVSSYRELLMNRWPNVNQKIKYTGQDIEKYKYSHPIKPLEKISIRVLDDFDTQAAKIVLEQELRDVVFIHL